MRSMARVPAKRKADRYVARHGFLDGINLRLALVALSLCLWVAIIGVTRILVS